MTHNAFLPPSATACRLITFAVSYMASHLWKSADLNGSVELQKATPLAWCRNSCGTTKIAELFEPNNPLFRVKKLLNCLSYRKSSRQLL